jgi:hypothetical protein
MLLINNNFKICNIFYKEILIKSFKNKIYIQKITWIFMISLQKTYDLR